MFDIFKFHKKDIIILDDILPSMLSPWRSNEYAELTKEFKKTEIHTDCSTYIHYNQDKSFDDNIKNLTANYPSLKSKIKIYNPKKTKRSKLVYLLFYNNLIKHFETITKNNIPFTFTLYPGGGFGFNDDELDKNLKKMLSHKLFKGVIVNQNITKKYLIDKQICDESLIQLIPGVPLNIDINETSNFRYSKPKDKTNILFFANKYTSDGADKGFDVFVKIVEKLYSLKETFNFIVIGGFTMDDVENQKIKSTIDFKGILNEFEFIDILKETHILISPNKPFILTKNAFDGFPLATCVTASLYGTLNFMTDYFNEGSYLNLIDGEDFIKINDDLQAITDKIIELADNKYLLKKIALNGRNKTITMYSFEKQITPRIQHFKKILL